MEIRASDFLSKSTEASRPHEAEELIVPKKVVFGGFAAILFFGLLLSGVLNRGYESKTVRSSTFSRATHGNSFGMKRMLLRSGQTLTVNYDTQMSTGNINIYLRKFWDAPGSTALGEARIDRSQSGQLRIPVSETGIYHLIIRPWPGTDGREMSYTVRWKAE